MAKGKSIFVCQSCGSQSPKWMGRCPDCQSWNSFVEESKAPEPTPFAAANLPLPLQEIHFEKEPRFYTGIEEFDRVLGGGLVRGSLVLIGGDPGIGKSTLILQTLDELARHNLKVLYVSGEESQQQIKLRAQRLGIKSNFLVSSENSLERIENLIQKEKPDVLVIDSIQTIYSAALSSGPASVSQVREATSKILQWSKSLHMASFIIGHVTKEGTLAGPRVLEHMVDCVLYFEGDSKENYRILRTFKNRFGSTQEIGVFEMGEKGLKEVKNPSALFLSERSSWGPGSVVTSSIEGLRPFLLEIQALVSTSTLANPRRSSLGLDSNRVSMMVAILEKIAGINLYMQDIYVNVAGGFRIQEPATDLAILAALASSFKNQILASQTLLVGEVGLSGEIRPVSHLSIRLNEAAKMGFTQCLVPKMKEKIKIPSLQIQEIENLNQALDWLFK